MGKRKIKYMDGVEFRNAGFLQESNRLFFHPHGLAIEVVFPTEGDKVAFIDADHLRTIVRTIGTKFDIDKVTVELQRALDAINKSLEQARPAVLGGVWDDRDDPEGIVFGDGCDPEKARACAQERARHRPHRIALFGGNPEKGSHDIQPPSWKLPQEET